MYFIFVDFYPEGSGDVGDRCDPDNTDDEDCYYDYDHSGYEGSGSDDDDDEDSKNYSSWNGHRHGTSNNGNPNYDRNQEVIIFTISQQLYQYFDNYVSLLM